MQGWLRGTLFVSLLCAGCGGSPSSGSDPGGGTRLKLGAYTTPREAYRDLIAKFKERWKQQSGGEITFEESYLGSGAQSRAIVGGFDADIAALSLEADIDRIADAGLIKHDWRAGKTKGMVSNSVVALAVRKGNPKGIKDWSDLARSGVEVLTPNPRTSGGAMWNIVAIYGAARRGFVNGVAKDDEAAALGFLTSVLKNVTAMDKGARESITNFEQGVGDVAITYENEILVGQRHSQNYELVLPRSTVLIENPVAIVDGYVDKHGTRAVAEAFVAYLLEPEAQKIFAEYGLRSVDAGVRDATASKFPKVEDQWGIDFLGGWKKVTKDIFGEGTGVYSKAIESAQKR